MASYLLFCRHARSKESLGCLRLLVIRVMRSRLLFMRSTSLILWDYRILEIDMDYLVLLRWRQKISQDQNEVGARCAPVSQENSF
jgi:hypothetical protein